MAGAAVVTLLARWSPIIRGHGIPEAMEAVLVRRSRIAPRTAVAKPLSAAIAIGTGGPFGAEGPIIVTGGAIGSLVGQVIHVSASERKILLACGAAAGMAATFGTPLAAVVLAIELLLFEFSPRALIPLVVATSVAGGVHAALFGNGPLFAVPAHGFTGLPQLPLFAILGLCCGLLAVGVSRGLFAVEGLFRRLPVGEAWHPIIGAAIWASLGLLVPRALGVGYDVIDDAVAGRLAIATLLALVVGKLVIWWIALGSGTSGGTLAPDPHHQLVLRRAGRPAPRSGRARARRRAVGVRPRRHGRHLRRRGPSALRRHRLPLRAHAGLQRDPPADAGHRPRRPAGPSSGRAQHHDGEAGPAGRERPRGVPPRSPPGHAGADGHAAPTS